MTSRSLVLTSRANRVAASERGSSSPDRHRNGQQGIPWPLHHRPEEGDGAMFDPWRLFEERVRTEPYGLTRFPLQPYSPIRILILDGGTDERVNPGLRRFISNSPPRIRGDWRLGPGPVPEEHGLTNEEFTNAMKKLKKQAYTPPNYPKKKRGGWKRSLFGTRSGSAASDRTGDERNDSKQCTICLETLVRDEQVLVTPCGHTFHHDCLVPWVKSHGQCPVCRFAFCERQERALPHPNGDGNDVSLLSEEQEMAIDLVLLLRAMEEAFSWVHLTH